MSRSGSGSRRGDGSGGGGRGRAQAPVLGTRALNRATLTRQLLLERSELPPLEAVSHLCGLQAQEPQEPFTGLWSRLRGFQPGALSDLLTGRQVVRTHLMRRTVHLVTAADVLAWRARHNAMLRQRVLGVYRRELAGVDLDELAAAGRDVLADGEPRSMAQLARAVADRWPEPGTRPLGEMLVAGVLSMVQLPPRGCGGRRRGAQRTGLFLAGARDRPAAHGGRFGSGGAGAGTALSRRVRARRHRRRPRLVRSRRAAGAVAALRGELVTFRDERGRELLDLPDAPRPDPETPLPYGFCPPSTTRSSATTTAPGSSTTPTGVCPSPGPGSSWSTAGSPRPGTWSRGRRARRAPRTPWSSRRCGRSPGASVPKSRRRERSWLPSSRTVKARGYGSRLRRERGPGGHEPGTRGKGAGPWRPVRSVVRPPSVRPPQGTQRKSSSA